MKRLRRLSTCKTTALVISCLLLSPAAQAADKALERAQFMLRQLNSQKVQLESKNAALTAELDALRKESAKQLKQQKAGNKKLDAAGKKKDNYIEKLKQKLKETLIALRTSEQERLQANSTGKALDSELKQCVSNNHQLVHMNDRLIENYNNKGVWDSIVQNEPFTGINQVEIENILQEYRFANEDYEVRQKTEYQQRGGDVSVIPDDEEHGG
jgi:hypothetical protein